MGWCMWRWRRSDRWDVRVGISGWRFRRRGAGTVAIRRWNGHRVVGNMDLAGVVRPAIELCQGRGDAYPDEPPEAYPEPHHATAPSVKVSCLSNVYRSR